MSWKKEKLLKAKIYKIHNNLSSISNLPATLININYLQFFYLKVVVHTVWMMLQAERPERKGNEQAGRHVHRPVAVAVGWVVSRVTRGVDVAVGVS